ncbi:SDR family oxidoreductase [Candidatus Nanopelagicales bacterium]|nr:SDR family oxidoreductase [Candidatus Nanopelagicales bacterium]
MDLGIGEKVALVTGGARGIGAAITSSLASEGAQVVFTSRHQATIDSYLDSIRGREFTHMPIGLVSALERKTLRELTDFFEQRNWNVDILVNNAGDTLSVTEPFCGPENWQSVLDLNTHIPIALVEMLAPGMITRNWGRIVNITSCAGLENSGPVTFSTAKAALTAYTRSMGRVLGTMADGVVMTAVFPGVVATRDGHWDVILRTDPQRAERYLAERCPIRRFGTEAEVADVVTFYCSDMASFSHGAIIPVDGGQSRHFMYHNYMD